MWPVEELGLDPLPLVTVSDRKVAGEVPTLMEDPLAAVWRSVSCPRSLQHATCRGAGLNPDPPIGG